MRYSFHTIFINLIFLLSCTQFFPPFLPFLLSYTCLLFLSFSSFLVTLLSYASSFFITLSLSFLRLLSSLEVLNHAEEIRTKDDLGRECISSTLISPLPRLLPELSSILPRLPQQYPRLHSPSNQFPFWPQADSEGMK